MSGDRPDDRPYAWITLLKTEARSLEKAGKDCQHSLQRERMQMWTWEGGYAPTEGATGWRTAIAATAIAATEAATPATVLLAPQIVDCGVTCNADESAL